MSIANELTDKRLETKSSELNMIAVKLTDINFSQLNNSNGHKKRRRVIERDVNTTKKAVRVVRDERKRANHNEVERRRRDTINKWIFELSKIIPDCSNDHLKQVMTLKFLK